MQFLRRARQTARPRSIVAIQQCVTIAMLALPKTQNLLFILRDCLNFII